MLLDAKRISTVRFSALFKPKLALLELIIEVFYEARFADLHLVGIVIFCN